MTFTGRTLSKSCRNRRTTTGRSATTSSAISTAITSFSENIFAMHEKEIHDGVVLIDKISGITSHDVVEKFRRRANVKKVGHTGTLDPLATGLLVLCVGKATRLQAYLMGMEKTYEGVIQ